MGQAALEGAFVAHVTPMKGDAAEVDLDALRRHVSWLIENGIDGLVPCGTTGEAATMSADERLAVIGATVEEAAGRVPVVAGVGTNCTRTTIEFARLANELGIDAILVVAPYYNKPNQRGLYAHFAAVAEAVPIPQVVYNVPGRTSCRIEVATLARLADLPHIVATKDATGDMVFGSETLEACGDRIAVLSGDDATTFPLLALGGRGAISVVGNVAPRLLSDLCGAAREARWTDARQLHYQTLPIFRSLFADTNPIPVKAGVAALGFGDNVLRQPLTACSESELRELLAALAEAGLIEEAA